MTIELAKNEPKQLTIVDSIRAARPNFEALLKASGTNIDRFQNNAIMAISNNAEISSGAVTSKSVFNVCSRAAQDGLMLDGKEAAIIIGFSNGKKEAQYRKMVLGVIKQIHRSPHIKRLITQVVYEGDIIDIQLAPDAGTNPVSHKIDWTKEREKILGAYAYAELTTGEYTSPEFMSVKQIEKIRDTYSKQAKAGMWLNSFDEACIKTVIHRASKRWPLSEDVGDIQDDDTSFEPVDITPESEQQQAAQPKPKRKTAAEKVKELSQSDTQSEAVSVSSPKQSEAVESPPSHDEDGVLESDYVSDDELPL